MTRAAEAMGAPELALPLLGGSGGGYFTARARKISIWRASGFELATMSM